MYRIKKVPKEESRGEKDMPPGRLKRQVILAL
jgi:hypothetical protein